ncbi:hypothetical protein EPZ47_24670 [Pseudomonas viciae]|uniref:Uncharacterized protein n=1 Tax=Pseudomonas viciae TaxID=2505979 RepID=A0A4P7PLI5_9PSED|nr:hypothetical protein EPZ47_24670 [Pseudomonas viciae]
MWRAYQMHWLPWRRTPWRGSLLPLACEAGPNKRQATAAQSSGSELPRHRFHLTTRTSLEPPCTSPNSSPSP